MNNPIFVVGCPRSGTTILSQLLAKTDYCEPFETHYITKYYKKLNEFGDLSEFDNFKRLFSQILEERPIMQWKLSIDVDRAFTEMKPPSYKNIINEIGSQIAKKQNKLFWGDKTPRYLFDLDIIYDLFPESKYIYIIRDGRDVALSLLERPWPPYNIVACAEYWKRINSPNQTLGILEEKKQLYTVRYEDLLTDPEQKVKEIYLFLGQDYNAEKMSGLIGKLKKGNFNKWQNKMKPYQIKLFEKYSANTLNRFGYETSYDETELNPLIKQLFNIHQSFCRAKWMFKQNIIDGIKIKFFGKEPFAE